MTQRSDTLTLYHSKTSVCSQKVRLVLAELGLQWQSHELNLGKGEQFEPTYLTLNPNGTVPTLRDSGLVLVNSNDAIIHLCRKFGGGGLFSEKSKIYQCINKYMALSEALHASVYVLTTLAMNREKFLSLPKEKLAERIAKVPNGEKAELLYDTIKNGIEGGAVTNAIDMVCSCFAELDDTLSAGDYLCGPTVTLADFAILPFVCRLGFLNLVPGQPKSDLKNLLRWQKLMQARPSYDVAVQRFHSAEVLQTYEERGTRVREQLKFNQGLSAIESRP